MPPSFAPNPLSIFPSLPSKSRSFLTSREPHHHDSPSSPDPTPPHSPAPLSPRSRSLRRFTSAVKLPSSIPTIPTISLRRTPNPPMPTPAAPTELLILAHGLQGTVEDFSYLLDELRRTPMARAGELCIHPSRVNTDKTHDGVALGGLRLAEDIRAVVAKYPSLQQISMMGFSLGGLYVRYAAGVLYRREEDGKETIAGLKARSVFVVASPNLGVRSFGVYRFVPQSVVQWATSLWGETVAQMMMADEDKILVEMSRDGGKYAVPFMSALRAFSERVAYANVRNDFMVNYGTAAMDHRIQVLGGADVGQVVSETSGDCVDEGYDERGCRICFETKYEEEEWEGEGADEEVMARRLKGLGWTVVAVDFPIGLPIAHNRIVAMSRGPVHTWLNASGRRVVHHIVDKFSNEFESHEKTFKAVVGIGRRASPAGFIGRQSDR